MGRIELDFSKPFIAAYSEKHRFKDSDKSIPDYHFHDEGKTHWVVKVGTLQIRWGVATDRFRAYGVVKAERKRVSGRSLDAKGLPFKQNGDAFYLYEEEFEDGEWVGFLPYLSQHYVNPLIEELLTDDKDAETFRRVLQQQSPENNKLLKDLTDDHALIFRSFLIQHIQTK